jgi:hypothetical protein
MSLVTDFKLGIYRHWKGGMYLARELVEDSNNNADGESTQEPTVIYTSLSGLHPGRTYSRWLHQWNDFVEDARGIRVSRFKYVGPV